ncbi:uncharacterized protein TNCV_2291011 [Trichonephila clavipes]|uniref:Uncharacterized protein n=1 Tax=Trichonephila clavipes TaxID=2585209 RepID=A0A8X6V6F5_TRICX|nr:uncharacterized protein TNCV_2291011 [Trichonephila clavipes]
MEEIGGLGIPLRCLWPTLHCRRVAGVSAVSDYCQLTGTLHPLLDSMLGEARQDEAVLHSYGSNAAVPGLPVGCKSSYRSLDSCRGVISETDLLCASETEILEGLSDQESPKLPYSIKAGYLNCKIRPYIPNPLRCFKWQRFGHSQTSCRGQLTSSRCASVVHSSTDCSLDPKCINCSQSHSSDSKLCPRWKTEKEIQIIKTNRNLSYVEARKLIVPQSSQTYAQAAKSSIKSNSTQTDENVTKVKCPPLNLLQPLPKPDVSISTPVISTSSSTQAHLLPSTSTAATVSEPLSTTYSYT